jgi:hypothetical protein
MSSAAHKQRRMGAWLLSLGVLLGAPGCSLLFDTGADQCQIDADCAKFGVELPLCQAGLCVAADASGGAAGKAGANGGGTGGVAGKTGAAECATNGDCIDAHFGQPFVCSEGACVALTTHECPLVIGAENLRAAEPIVFGAYALAPDGVSPSVVSRNLKLAVDEFTSKVTGLRGGPNGSRRTLAFVVCNSYFPDAAPDTIDAFLPSLSLLVDTLHVPGIVAALPAKSLQAVFAQRLDAAGVFVISPYEQDSELAALSDGGRLWHMLGATSDLAPAFAPLLKRTETYLRRDESFLKLASPGAKLRVAVVSANIARETDVRDALLDLSVLDDFEVEPFQVESALLSSNPDASEVTSQLLDYAPNIIVALAGSEFIEQVFPALEAGNTWSTRTGGQQRPFYVLGSTMGPQTWSLYSAKQGDPGGWKSFFDRIVGVAYASAEQPKLLQDYELRLISASQDQPDPSVVLGSESAYDAAYLMIYAAAAAGEVPELTGKNLATGMRRLVEGAAYDVGPASISKVLTALDNGEDIGLRLTLGEPSWNLARGTRQGVGSVYCLNNGAFDYETDFPLGPDRDALRFDPATSTLETKPLPCIPNF